MYTKNEPVQQGGCMSRTTGGSRPPNAGQESNPGQSDSQDHTATAGGPGAGAGTVAGASTGNPSGGATNVSNSSVSIQPPVGRTSSEWYDENT